jgi:hypothetical protein
MAVCGLLCFASCSDMLDTKTNSSLDTDDNTLHSPNDSLYSLIGIVKQMQQLGERYVLLGELRGELMSVTPNADIDLQTIADFTATTDNRYASTREYYAVINNCNYFLQHVDTTIVSGGKRVMLGEYALAKTLRAWTYLQLGLNYGKVIWLTEPILNIDDMNRQYEEVTLEALLPRLIADIAPYKDLQDFPSYGSINSVDATRSFIPVRILLADLFLWQGAYTGNQGYYTDAANIYYRWFTTDRRTAFGATGNLYGAWRYATIYNNSDFRSVNYSWNNTYNTTAESISLIRYNNVFSENPNFPPLLLLCIPSNTAETYWVKPSQAAMDLWDNEMYAFYRPSQQDVVYTKGDLRGRTTVPGVYFPIGSYGYTDTNEADSIPYIAKYGYIAMNGLSANYNINLYREGLLYLRYAEALNALGKPSLAFAVLKYGMKATVLNDPTKITPDEIDPLPGYCDFMDDAYMNNSFNYGIHNRGSGDVERDTIYYAFTPETLLENRAYYGIPAKLDTKADSIAFVNVMICKELGLETAFEGNRFHDLMRLSRQYERYTGKSDFLSKWVGRRNPALEAKLADPANWYLPSKQE